MRFSTFIALAAFLFLLSRLASADPWKIDANLNLTTGVNSYSNNWVGGEAGNFTWGSQFLGAAEKQISKTLNTKTTLNMQFGQTEVQDKTTKHWSLPQKSTDLIDGLELLKLTLGEWADPFASVRAISQFADESDPAFLHYVNPWDITETVGANRTLSKSEAVEWSTRAGGAAHQIVDRYHLDTIMGKRSTDVTSDGGVEFDMDLKAINKAKWITFLSSLRIYEALASNKANAEKGTPEENFWRYPHVKWENNLTLSVAKYLMLNVSAYLYYDKDIATDIRLKETFAAGVTYVYSKK